MLSKCVSLISLPDISKWKTKSLKEMYSLFSNFLSLLYIHDISIWDNYNEDHLKSIPDYNRLDKILNFPSDYYKEISNPGSYNVLNDNEIKKQIQDKINKFL